MDEEIIFSKTVSTITIASAPPRRESALLNLARTRKKDDIKDQMYCVCVVDHRTIKT